MFPHTNALIKSKKLIEDPRHWTRKVYAVDDNGNMVDPSSPEVAAWSIEGAVLVSNTNEEDYEECLEFIKDAIWVYTRSHGNIDHFNDHASHDVVVEIFDLAIDITKIAEELAKTTRKG